jgi:hypothetical protein
VWVFGILQGGNAEGDSVVVFTVRRSGNSYYAGGVRLRDMRGIDSVASRATGNAEGGSCEGVSMGSDTKKLIEILLRCARMFVKLLEEWKKEDVKT